MRELYIYSSTLIIKLCKSINNARFFLIYLKKKLYIHLEHFFTDAIFPCECKSFVFQKLAF